MLPILSARSVAGSGMTMTGKRADSEKFCHEAFFGPDELFSHMRNKHEECFVCKQMGEKDV